jgi:GAF domain-containing protein
MGREQNLGRAFVDLADIRRVGFDVVDLMRELCAHSVELLPVDAAGLILADDDGRLQAMGSTGEQALVLELLALRNSEGPALDSYRACESIVNLDVDQAGRRWPLFQAAMRDMGFQVCHTLPLQLRGQALGALDLFCSTESFLSDDDQAVGQALCEVVAVGLLQERDRRETEALTLQLQDALTSRVVIEQAKGMLAVRGGIDVETAFAVMRGWARRNRRPLAETAAAVVDGRLTDLVLRDG